MCDERTNERMNDDVEIHRTHALTFDIFFIITYNCTRDSWTTTASGPGWRGERGEGANETVYFFHPVRDAPARGAQDDGAERRAARARKRRRGDDARGEAHREHFHRSERPEGDHTDAREHRAREYGRVHAVHVHRERRDRT